MLYPSARSGIRKHANMCGRLRRNFTAVNVFGLNQYDGQTQFFDPSNPLLPEVRALLQARHPSAPVASSALDPGPRSLVAGWLSKAALLMERRSHISAVHKLTPHSAGDLPLPAARSSLVCLCTECTWMRAAMLQLCGARAARPRKVFAWGPG